MLVVDDFTITDDPVDSDSGGFFLNGEGPMPNGAYDRDDWRVDICRWVLDDPEDEESSATGEPMPWCNATNLIKAGSLTCGFRCGLRSLSR